jgi:hypothetical protein
MLLVFAPIFGARVLPTRWQTQLADWLADVDLTTAMLVVAAALLILDSALLAIAAARFQRTKLILD